MTGGSAHFTLANEWIHRDIDDDGNDDYTLTYDAAGNLTDDGKDYTYTYDVWGRLRTIDDRLDADPVSAYEYNGLGWRITAIHNTDSDSTLADETEENLVYTARWQPVAIYEGSTLKEQTLAHQAGLDGAGGSSYIDSVILRTTYVTAGETTAEDLRFYYNQNWRADVSVVLDVARRIAATSTWGHGYGVATACWSTEWRATTVDAQDARDDPTDRPRSRAHRCRAAITAGRVAPGLDRERIPVANRRNHFAATPPLR